MGRGARWWVAMPLAVGAIAFAVRLVVLLRGAGLGGMLGYDDGVYYSAAGSLVWGRVPYRDFLLLHPPGIVVALAPFAGFGRLTSDALGFETARVAWMLVGAVNAGLVVVAARRLGWVAAGVAGLFYAWWRPVVLTETTTRLEPLLNLGLLVALALLAGPDRPPSRRVQVLAGCGLGLALAVKIWAVVPVAVVWLWCRSSLGPRAARRVGLACLLSAVALYLPFWAAAPGPMTRMVVLDQLGRVRAPVPVSERLAVVLGTPTWSATTTVVAAAVGVLAVLAVLGRTGPGRAPLGRAPLGRAPLGRWAVGLLGLQVLVLVVSPPFFDFYAAYVVPALALVVATGVATLVALLRRAARATRPGLVTTARAGGVAVLGLAFVPLAVVDARTTVGVPLPAGDLRALTASSRCVTSDSPDMLVLLDVLGRNLARDCPVLVDVSGLTYDTAARQRDGHHVPRAHNTVWQRTLRRYLLSGETTVVARPGADRLNSRTRSVLRQLPVLHQGEGYTLFAVPAPLRSAVGRGLPDDEPGSELASR